MAQCPKCGTHAEAKFCPNCGSPITPAAAASQAPQYPPQPPQQFPPQQQYPPQGYPPQAPQYAPPGYPPYQQMPPQRPSSPWKWVAIIGGALLGLIVLVIVVLAMLPEEDPIAYPNAPVTVATSVVKNVPIITNKVNDQTQAPIGELKTVPPSTDAIYASIEVEVKKDDILGAKWYYKGQQQTHLDTELPFDKNFKGWASFSISNDGKPWPVATYKVEIYLNGKKVQEKAFEVK